MIVLFVLCGIKFFFDWLSIIMFMYVINVYYIEYFRVDFSFDFIFSLI